MYSALMIKVASSANVTTKNIELSKSSSSVVQGWLAAPFIVDNNEIPAFSHLPLIVHHKIFIVNIL